MASSAASRSSACDGALLVRIGLQLARRDQRGIGLTDWAVIGRAVIRFSVPVKL